MQLVLATGNHDKIVEIKQLLDDLPVTILTKDDYLEWPEVEENGATFEENAILKATAIAEFTDLPALADDSGLEVDALDGAPGIFSARFAGENCSYQDNNLKLLAELSGIESAKRTARFRCVIAICWTAAVFDTMSGTVDGKIANEQEGTEGFGYDPLFYHPPSGKRFSEMTDEGKNRVSHRGIAMMEARSVIMQKLNERSRRG